MRFEQHQFDKYLPLFLAFAAFFVGANPAAAEGVTDVILSSGSFQIPFNIAAGGVQPREVHLYMATANQNTEREGNSSRSSAAAQKWQLLDRQSPGVGQFQLSETPDGVFWFAVRTIDAGGRPHPPGPISPELQVTVDTTQPAVDLIAEADADGKVTAVFSASDVTGVGQFSLHYVTDTLQQWQTTTIQLTDQGGRFAFDPTDVWNSLTLRLRAVDGAGNETIIKKRLQKPRVATSGSTRLASGPLGFGNPLNFGYSASQGQPSQVQPQGPTPNVPAINVPAANGSATQSFAFGSGMPMGYPPGSSLPGNSSALPPPSTGDEISQDFGRPAPPFELLPNGVAEQSGFPERGRAMLPGQHLGAPLSEIETLPQTAAEAMRPLQQQSSPPSLTPSTVTTVPPTNPPTATPKSSVPPANAVESIGRPAGTPDAMPQTPFQTETIPAPAGQPPAPTQLNRPALPEINSDTSASGPAVSPWSPIDSNRPRNPSREFSTKPTPRPVTPGELPQSTADSSPRQEQRREPIGSSNPLDLERLSQRAIVRHSNSKQFSLDYEIEAIGGRGVEEIELYGTTDGGQTWKKWGSDPDKLSPFDIETNGEGIFGFQIVVVASNGLASPRPLNGESPDIVVVVDETLPSVGISGAKYGESDRAGSLVITYYCEDTYLMSRPITLAFSDSSTGPWTTIAAGLRNTGDYVWPADPQLPRQIYLRIDATDQAGNVGSYVLEEPIDTRGLAPRARIRAFRSIPSR